MDQESASPIKQAPPNNDAVCVDERARNFVGRIRLSEPGAEISNLAAYFIDIGSKHAARTDSTMGTVSQLRCVADQIIGKKHINAGVRKNCESVAMKSMRKKFVIGIQKNYKTSR